MMYYLPTLQCAPINTRMRKTAFTGQILLASVLQTLPGCTRTAGPIALAACVSLVSLIAIYSLRFKNNVPLLVHLCIIARM